MSNRISLLLVLGAVIAAMAAAAVLGGCKRKAEYNGIGAWVFGKSTFEHVSAGGCTKQAGVVWCGSDPLDKRRSVDLGGQNGVVGLYFANMEKAGPLLEVVIEVRPCDSERLAAYMKHKFGKPSAVKGIHQQWRFKHMFMQAKLPPGEACQLSAVAAGNEKRIAELDKAAAVP